MKIVEKMQARRRSWLPDPRFLTDGSGALRFLPPPQRDPVALAAWLNCSVGDVAVLRPNDVADDGVRLRGRLVCWPPAIPAALRERVIGLARKTPGAMRIFETHKPSIRAAFDLRSAMVHAITSSNAAQKMKALRVAVDPPNFLVLGVPRSATTWLYRALATHPDVYLPKTKEQEFFGDYKFYLGWNWYLTNFVERDRQSVAGDVSVGYFHSREAPHQIAELLGADVVKLVVILREPIERAKSYFNYRLIRGMIPSTFEDAISIPYFHDLFVAQSHYARYLERWHAKFSTTRLLVLLYENIRDDPASALATIANFLDISPDGFVVPPKENDGVSIAPIALHRFLLRNAANLDVALPSRAAAFGRFAARQLRQLDARLCLHKGMPYRVPLRADTELRLREEFAPSNERLARMTGIDLSPWRHSANRNSDAAASFGVPTQPPSRPIGSETSHSR